MANAHETTFGNLQNDERYKKLERTLKMALLKSGERINTDNGNTGTWPNVSSINSDHLDISLAAMSVQSSRFGSEVVSSSTNLRNILLHKQHFSGSGHNAATSSENQFSTNKNNADCAMMPPPRTPGVPFSRTKRFSGENSRIPLSNMPLALGRNTNGFVVSTPSSSISSIQKYIDIESNNTSQVFQDNNNYEIIAYEEGTQKRERSFCKWRVLLNDKGALIIKGTLECGKIARSKPVIRTLTHTSVQSIFKHTYHLLGNLVDDRNELPDYVRGKFHSGFPDDWENVCQVWRAFINDGNRLSFRWPTPVTDSDDDIKSEITEIVPRRARYKKSVSPRKRNRSAKTSLILDLSSANTENRPDRSSSSCSHLPPDGTPLQVSVQNNNPPPENVQRSNSKNNLLKESRKSNAMIVDREQFNESSVASFNTTTRNSVNSLDGIITEDKINIIINNLTDKNCTIEYIDTIVKMFDCMKYVVSYQSSVENGSEKIASTTPVNNSRLAEEKINSANTSSSKNHVNDPHLSVAKEYGNQLPSSNTGILENEKLHKNHDRQTRRKLSTHDYDETSESDNDSYDETRITPMHQYPTSNERLRKMSKYNNPPNLVASRISKESVEPKKSSDGLCRQYTEPLVIRTQRHDVGDEKFVAERQREQKLRNNRAFMSPKKIRGVGKENRRETVYYDSCISITDDDERYTEETETKDMRENNDDSSVSTTEDEDTDVRGQTRMRTRNNHTESNVYPLQPEIRGIENSRDDRKRLNDLNYGPDTNSRYVEQSLNRNGNRSGPRKKIESSNHKSESNARHAEQDVSRMEVIPSDRRRQDSLNSRAEPNSRPVEQAVSRNTALHTSRVPRKLQALTSPTPSDDDRDFPIAPNPIHKVYSSTANVLNVNNPPKEQQNDLAYLSSNIKRSKQLIVNREITEIESSKSFSSNHPNALEIQKSSEITEMPPPKSKTPQTIRKKPSVLSVETVQTNITPNDSHEFNGERGVVMHAGNLPQKYVDVPKENKLSNVPKKDQKNHVENPPEIIKPSKTRSREGNGSLNVLDGKSSTRENKVESFEKPLDSAKKLPNADYGSEANPKLLTAWVPAIKCDDIGDNKHHLIFKGKLLNEAGHITDRKFTTDSIRRRLSPKIIETINHNFYELVGDLNDTKHVVPKELIKLCHIGCPGKIGYFCERWAILGGEICSTSPQNHLVNTSVDCLSVPMSSRGRRILPPLHYWAGERVVTKDNKTMYSARSSQESSIPSSLENTTSEVRMNKNSPNTESDSKRTKESRSTDTKKKDVDKILSPSVNKTNLASPSKLARRSQRPMIGKRRLTNNVQSSSSDDDDTKTKPTPRKRKTRVNDQVVNTENSSTRRLRNSGKNLEQTNISPNKSSFEKSSEPEVKLKLRKRQKIDDNQGTLQQFITRRASEIKCVGYKNVPMHDGDLSEDQLSTM